MHERTFKCCNRSYHAFWVYVCVTSLRLRGNISKGIITLHAIMWGCTTPIVESNFVLHWFDKCCDKVTYYLPRRDQNMGSSSSRVNVARVVALLSAWVAVSKGFHVHTMSARRTSTLSMRAEIAPRKVGMYEMRWYSRVVFCTSNTSKFNHIHLAMMDCRLSSLILLRVDWMIDLKWMTFLGSSSFVNMRNLRFQHHRRK